MDGLSPPSENDSASWRTQAPIRSRGQQGEGGSGAVGRSDQGQHGCGSRSEGQAAIGASHTATFPGERYHRIARRRGKAKAQVAVARSILVIISLGDLGVGLAKARK